MEALIFRIRMMDWFTALKSFNSIVEPFGNYENVSSNLNLSPPPKQEESNPFLTYSGDTQNYQGYTNNFLEPSLNAATNFQQRVAQEEAAEIAEREQSENLIDRFTNVSNVSGDIIFRFFNIKAPRISFKPYLVLGISNLNFTAFKILPSVSLTFSEVIG